ncbi:ciliogenesis and planar polarity effector 1 [Electrophorus electricus]|uniref:ciliogenesis and planar polarity effector 1 n=1 Tax=Electrophorus electricus TaxID=8005 RepID=UPI0015CFC090|nr:ciliogenesis and planar polarity effector 1 [Electrophorus electricus]
MEIKFEVLLSSSIRRRKPWPRFCWLGKEKEGVFLLDDTRISEINLVTGQTKRKTPKLQPLLPRVVTMSGSQNGMWLAGILVSGELFLWNRDKDSLKTVTSVPAVYELVSLCKATSLHLSLLVSGDGKRVLLVTVTGQVFLWECLAPKELYSLRDGTIRGRWSQIVSSENAQLPSAKNKEASLHCVFVQSQAVGDVCLSAFVFISGEHLTVTFLMMHWEEPRESTLSSEGYSVQWVTKSYPLGDLMPPCQPVESRGALVPAFSPDGQLLAVILNQKDPRATQALFISLQNFVTVTSLLGGCGSKSLSIPRKYLRSYWVSSASWTPEGLYLACVLKRGSLLMLARLGGLVSLSTTGCDVEFGPAHFLPLHPLVTYRPPVAPDDACSSSGASLRDTMRQRYSVTWHPRLPCLIVSDGYMATVLKVPARPSAVALLSHLLLDTARGLERARAVLGSEQPQVRPKLESMSSLKFTASLAALKEQDTTMSTLPLFLRDGVGTGSLRTTVDRVQGYDDRSDSDEGQYVPAVMEHGGRLEFASMFDTLHAHPQSEPEDADQGVSTALQELGAARRSLLTAWALGLSLGGAVDQRRRLLRLAISCAVQLARLLRIARPGGGAEASCVFDLLGTLLSFLSWDSPSERGRSCLGVAVDLAGRFAHLSLADGVRSSRSFAETVLLLQEVSKSLDQSYSLPQRMAHPAQGDRPPSLSDMFLVPLLQDAKESEAGTSHLLLLNRPSKRLVAIWRNLYRQALQYQAELYGHRAPSSQSKELENMSNIISQIQEVLQKAGDHLERSHALHDITGERHFILGEYHECIQAWWDQLWAESERAGPRACFLETRYCLALLFTRLFCYQLREAQAMCDLLAFQLQSQSGMAPEDDPAAHAPSSGNGGPFDGRLLWRVNREAACAVVQSLGRFMASYFTNQPLVILPPHNVDVLPPLHLPPAPGRRVVALSQSRAAGAVRVQQLSGVWTVDYALELLLLGGLLPEAVWLAWSLGDWKTAASLGLAYGVFCRQHYDFGRLKWRELHLPAELRPGHIFQVQLEALMGGTSGCGRDDPDTVDADDAEALLVSVQEILKASAVAEVDVVSRPLGQLLDSAKERASALRALVPHAFYLPAPPLYCPQPAPNTQDSAGGGLLAVEREARCRVATALQRLLLLLRASRCSHPAACWYVDALRRCRLLFRKVKRGNVESKDDVLPEGLKKFTNGHGVFRPGPGRNRDMDSVAKQTIVCFRELCGLCWMLHVRDQLTVSCRRYQNARNKSKDFQAVELHEEALRQAELREEALRWACRLLPFSRFLTAEEVLQDLVLSLVAELPPGLTVAETLALVFPDEEESVRVPLREKYSSLLQRLGRCSVHTSASATPPRGVGREEEEGETMMVLIQDQRRQRLREERRLARSLAPLERHLWETEEEDTRGDPAAILNRFSLGSSLSASTLTDGERPLVVSEGDITDTPSESRSPDPQSRPHHKSKDERRVGVSLKSVNEGGRRVSVTEQGEDRGPCLPTVGTWRFELEDEEYPRFLELFLSYVLEKDGLDVEEAELPLLSGFSSQLCQRELHSDAFDVLSTLRRRQAGQRRGARLPVFRAGRCFRTLLESPEPPTSVGPVLSPAPTRTGAVPGKRPGLFGLRQQGGLAPGDAPLEGRTANVEANPVRDPLPWSLQTERWPFKTVLQPDVELQLGLDSRLEAQFPRLARLLEWMLRWADRSVLLTQPLRKKPEGAGEPVVIRAKASAPAVLSALRLLELRYTAALLGIDRHYDQIQVPHRELTVAPVLQPQPGWTRDRESSLDTGYPASAGTPITIPDLDLQHGPSSPACEPEEVQEEHNDPSLPGHKGVTSDLGGEASFSGHKDVTSDPDVEEEDATRENKLLPLADSEGDSSTQQTHSRTLSGPRDKTLTLSDLEGPGTDDDSSETISEEGTTLKGGPEKSIKETACSPVCGAPEPASVLQMQQHCAPGPDPLAGATPASRPPTGALPQNGAGTHPDPVRQLLHDELFRLVQLQQINFMSLMQVVGASFANLPLTQGNPLLTQPSGSVVPPASPAQVSQDTVPENMDRPTSASGPKSRRSRPAGQQVPSREEEPGEERSSPVHSGVDTREIQQLVISSHWSKDQAEGFTAASRGLLPTVENRVLLQEPPSGRSQDRTIFPLLGRTVPVSRGLRLLHLSMPQPTLLRPPPPAPVREAWGPAPRLLNLSQHVPADPTAPPRHLNRNQYATQAQPPVREAPSNRGTGGVAVRLPPAPHTAVTAVGLPLLRCPPAAQACPVQLPRLPLAAPGRHPTPGPVAVGLQLLSAEPEPPSAGLRYGAPPARAPRLLPLEELRARAAAAGRGAEHRLRLLTADGGTRSDTTSAPSNKRLKRRDQKGGVSFRPEDSIILPLQPEDEGPTVDDDFVFPLGSFDSMLTGQRLLAAAHSTSAELHAFAATHKQPPEIQDAGTNTDPDPPRSVTDKAVTAQLPVTLDPAAAHDGQGMVAPVVPPDEFLNLLFPGNDPLDQQGGSRHAEPNALTTAVGRRFISVVDLEDDALFQDLPPAPPHAPFPAHTISDPPPTSALLHLLAASVTNPAPTEPEVDPCPDLSTADRTDEVLDRLATASHSTVVPSVSGAGGDSLGTRAQTGGRAPDEVEPARHFVEHASSSHGRVSAHLSELDARLAALQSIADHMDREFANTRLLVSTIETLAPVVMSSDDPQPHSSALGLIEEAESSRHAVCHELGNVREDMGEPRQGGVFSSTPKADATPGLRGRPSLAVASARSLARQPYAAPTVKPEQRPWDDSQELSEPFMENSATCSGARHRQLGGGGTLTGKLLVTSQIPEPLSSITLRVCVTRLDLRLIFLTRRTDDAWAVTGLSDVADILAELVREGALSPSELRPSPSAARPDSRREERQRRGMVEQERKELRAWMRRRQRERLVEYHRQREEKRQLERLPFAPPFSKPSSRDLTINKKIKEERDKQVLLRHHSQRAHEACNLITDLLSAPHSLRPASSAGAPPLSRDSRPRSRSLSAEKRKTTPPSRRGRARAAAPLGRTLVLQKRPASHPPATLSTRLGLHRPVRALPGDRLSQVTRRGMLSDERARPRIKTAAPRPKTSLSRLPAEQQSAGHREPPCLDDVEKREVVSPWDIPLEIRRILGLDSKDQGRSLLEGDRDKLDTLSQSTGSMLSKLDWAAIEKIVAGEEEM